MIEIHGGKIPNSTLTMYQICSDRGNRFWNTPINHVIGTIINGVVTFDKPHSKEEYNEAMDLWKVMSITEKF